MVPTDVVRAAFEAYVRQDRLRADALMAEDLVFTSPQDDHIDRDAYFDRCFPTADRVASQDIIELVSAGSDGVFLMYEYRLKTGERHRNTEFLRVRNEQIVEIQVFFGGRAD
jgi:ketosteroid isomerase-like protein